MHLWAGRDRVLFQKALRSVAPQATAFSNTTFRHYRFSAFFLAGFPCRCFFRCTRSGHVSRRLHFAEQSDGFSLIQRDVDLVTGTRHDSPSPFPSWSCGRIVSRTLSRPVASFELLQPQILPACKLIPYFLGLPQLFWELFCPQMSRP